MYHATAGTKARHHEQGREGSNLLPSCLMQLGDTIHEALSRIGITPELVERLVGPNCGCSDRQERLNQLGRWASRVLRGKVHKAEEYLKELLQWKEDSGSLSGLTENRKPET